MSLEMTTTNVHACIHGVLDVCCCRANTSFGCLWLADRIFMECLIWHEQTVKN